MNNIDYLSLALDQVVRSITEIQFTKGLLPAQWVVLRYLDKANKYSLTPGFVAKFIGTTNGTASQTLDSLEKKGYVRKLRNTADKRVVNLRLTKAGKEILKSDPIRKLLIHMENDENSQNQQQSQIHLQNGLEYLISELRSGKVKNQFGFCKYCEEFQPCEEKNSGIAGFCDLNHEAVGEEETWKICAIFAQVSTSDKGAPPETSAKGTSLAAK
ncbi:MAG: MarR family transcriptional regulator [Sneathiella sp.]